MKIVLMIIKYLLITLGIIGLFIMGQIWYLPH